VKTYLASTNAGKLRELEAIFAGSELDLVTYREYREPAEDAPSYIGNAILKARALAEQLREAGVEPAVLADDSGIEVDALGGRPGLRSARYAGPESDWPQRRALLLSELQGVPDLLRTARFVCVMALIIPGRELLTSLGVVEGYVLGAERGSGGFGYDPLFLYPAAGLSFAELAPEEKNAVSHRRRAADALLAALRSESS
jgi:XTP/dITP diphosphohydrolase